MELLADVVNFNLPRRLEERLHHRRCECTTMKSGALLQVVLCNEDVIHGRRSFAYLLVTISQIPQRPSLVPVDVAL